jgi:hypothetical protein
LYIQIYKLYLCNINAKTIKMKTLKDLQDYANSTDNIWLSKKLEVLELEIDSSILKSKISTINELQEKL